MSSPDLYRAIGEGSRDSLASNEPCIDALALHPSRDFRRGISLIIPVRLEGNTYRDLIGALASIEPDQYYYPVGDLHTTIFDFASAREDFAPDPVREAAFLDIARRACGATAPFELRFEGVACSREAGLMAGYDGDALVKLRCQIREALSAAGLENDERYISRSAHCCFMRFASRLLSPQRFLEGLEAWGNVVFGAVPCGAAELVEHDWYNREGSLRSLGTCGFSAESRERSI